MIARHAKRGTRSGSAESGVQGLPPVLCYHRVGGPLELGVTRIAASVFRRQMETLARTGWRTLTLAEYAAQLRTTHHAPRTVVLSFDDGYASLVQHVYPVLADLGFTATTFLITDYVGVTNAWDVPYAARRIRHLDWSAIEQWQARGFGFGSHTATHPRLTWLDDGRVQDELQRSRDVLVRRLGPEAGRAIAYPFGAADGRVAALAAAAGYTIGFGGRGVMSLLQLGRTPVYVWDAGNVPVGLRDGPLGWLGRRVAAGANRCAVGTSAMLALRNAALGLLRPAPQRDREEDRAR